MNQRALVTSPFDLGQEDAYLRWREWKLAYAMHSADDLVVEVRNPCALVDHEKHALMERIRRCNMAIYAGKVLDEDPEIMRALGRQFGLSRPDANWLAEEDGISEIKVSGEDVRKTFIPYTDKPIKWHTDGYYNPPERLIHAMVLHCVRSAAEGGGNRLLDPEIAYILLRDQDPEHIRALMLSDAMLIPERTDDSGVARPAQGGPVFSLDAGGNLHMRYTARTRSIAWKEDAAVQAAVAALEAILADESSPYILRTRLEPGMGLVCNNVLHDRSGFRDDPAHPRLLYRGRYLERIAESVN